MRGRAPGLWATARPCRIPGPAHFIRQQRHFGDDFGEARVSGTTAVSTMTKRPLSRTTRPPGSGSWTGVEVAAKDFSGCANLAPLGSTNRGAGISAFKKKWPVHSRSNEIESAS